MSGYGNILDHPVIRNLERTGRPDGKEPPLPHCPICGGECETVYRNRAFAIVGCDNCIGGMDAWAVDDCFPAQETEEDAE